MIADKVGIPPCHELLQAFGLCEESRRTNANAAVNF
jgi:hypothetical protein